MRDEMVGARTQVVTATGRVLVPGYIDPHVHPATLTTPSALARFILPLGTTAVVADTLELSELVGPSTAPPGHPATLTPPSALPRFILPLGTTAVVADTLQFWELGGLAAFRTVADSLLTAPLHYYWMIRPHAQSGTPDEWRRFGVKTLAKALAHPRTLAVGEVTRWPDAWRGDPE